MIREGNACSSSTQLSRSFCAASFPRTTSTWKKFNFFCTTFNPTPKELAETRPFCLLLRKLSSLSCIVYWNIFDQSVCKNSFSFEILLDSSRFKKFPFSRLLLKPWSGNSERNLKYDVQFRRAGELIKCTSSRSILLIINPWLERSCAFKIITDTPFLLKNKRFALPISRSHSHSPKTVTPNYRVNLW